MEGNFYKNLFDCLNDLKKILKGNDELSAGLLKSLDRAHMRFEKNGNKDLYEAINKVYQIAGTDTYNAWPHTIEAYLAYLYQHAILIPNELPPLLQDGTRFTAWKNTGDHDGYNQKVYDLLCHFYWLIDQKVLDGKPIQSQAEFAEWLIAYCKVKEEFLDSPESFNVVTKWSFKCNKMYNTHLYSDDEVNWVSFNTFFGRQFNGADKVTGITPLRPIAEPENNLTIVSPAECTYKQDYPIDENGEVRNVIDWRNIRIKLKRFHSIGKIEELLTDPASHYAKDFYGGTFVHYFLNPFDYHRFHAPVKGKVLECMDIKGEMYLDLRIVDGQFDAPDNSTDGYEFRQARGLIIIDGGKDVGKVAILPIGMGQVSGVVMYTELKGKEVLKGQEFGKFKFGGSDIIMLFQKPPEKLYFFKRDPGHVATHFQYGQTAVYWNGN